MYNGSGSCFKHRVASLWAVYICTVAINIDKQTAAAIFRTEICQISPKSIEQFMKTCFEILTNIRRLFLVQNPHCSLNGVLHKSISRIRVLKIFYVKETGKGPILTCLPLLYSIEITISVLPPSVHLTIYFTSTTTTTTTTTTKILFRLTADLQTHRRCLEWFQLNHKQQKSTPSVSRDASILLMSCWVQLAAWSDFSRLRNITKTAARCLLL